MYNQGFGIADIGKMRKKLYAVNKFLAGLNSSLYPKTYYRTCSFGQVFFSPSVVLMTGKPCIVNPVNQRMLLQPFGNLYGIFHMAGHPDMESLQPLQEKE